MKARDKTEEGDEARVCGEVCLPVIFKLKCKHANGKIAGVQNLV